MNGAKRTTSLSSLSQGNATFPAFLFIASHRFFFLFFFFAIIPTTTMTDNTDDAYEQYKQRNGTPDTCGPL